MKPDLFIVFEIQLPNEIGKEYEIDFVTLK
jgi:hypothetical protein